MMIFFKQNPFCVVTVRVSSTTRGCFHSCVSVQECTPSLDGGTYLGQGVLTLDWGVGTGGVATLDGVYLPYMEYLPWTGRTYPEQWGTYPGWGYLPWTGVTYPSWRVPTLHVSVPTLDVGVLTLDGGGIYLGWGYLPWMGYSRLDGGTLTQRQRHSSTVSTCYAAGSTSLAFTQEDFLVFILRLRTNIEPNSKRNFVFS